MLSFLKSLNQNLEKHVFFFFLEKLSAVFIQIMKGRNLKLLLLNVVVDSQRQKYGSRDSVVP